MSLSLVQSVQSVFNPSNVHAEVAMLRDVANNMIGAREVARSFINTHLTDMPVLVEGEHFVSYTDDRGETQVKGQAKNLSLWCAALQTTIEIGHTSYDLLAQIFRDWAKNTLQKEWSKEQAKGLAKKYVNSMQAQNILSDKLTKMEYTLEDGTTGEGVVVKLSDTFRECMNAEIETLREHTHYKCRPLKFQPDNWVDAVTGIAPAANLPLIKGKQFSGNKITQPVLDAVNKLQAVKFVVSPYIIDAAYDMLDNQHEFQSTEEELRMYQEVIQYKDGEYHFPVTMDTRGRMYYRGGLLSPQGSDFCKAAFQFANSRPLGEFGWRAICIHLANQLGADKMSIDDRLAFIRGNHHAIMSVEDHVHLRTTFRGANVFQALVAIKEYQRIAVMIDDNIDWNKVESNLVCHQDGTCNGLQHMAAITRNRQTAITVNCVASTWSDTPADIYGMVAEAAVKYVAGNQSALDLIKKYGRDMAKNPVMIQGYGATEPTVIKNTAKYLIEKGEDNKLAEVIGKAYVDAIADMAGAVKAMTGVVKTRVGEAMKNNGLTKFQWTTADGFVACTEYRDYECNRVRAGVFNALVRNMHPAPIDDVKTVGAMAPNFVHSIDATHLRMVVNACDHELVTVHDSIGSHAGTFFDTASVIRQKFVEVHNYDAIGNLCENMGVRAPKFRGDYSAYEALESAYIFS